MHIEQRCERQSSEIAKIALMSYSFYCLVAWAKRFDVVFAYDAARSGKDQFAMVIGPPQYTGVFDPKKSPKSQ
jgi:hypothetical protein